MRERAAAPAAPPAKHDWMHHFATYRQRQAEAAAANARRVSTSDDTPPNTFKRFLDGQDQSAFAQLGFKHMRRPDGSCLPVGKHTDMPTSTAHMALPCDGASPTAAMTQRTYSDGAAMHPTQQPPLTTKMSPSEAAVIELFVSASRAASGPALSAPAQLDERIQRMASDQTHTPPFVDNSPITDPLGGGRNDAATPILAPQAPGAQNIAAASPCTGDKQDVAAGAPDLGRAATMPVSGILPAMLDTVESAETVHRAGGSGNHLTGSPVGVSAPMAGAANALLPDLPWDAWREQLRIFALGCNTLPEGGELGAWCSEQLEAALHLAAGSPPVQGGMTRHQYALLTAVPQFAQRLAVIERQVFSECLWRLQQFIDQHLRMPSRWHLAADAASLENANDELRAKEAQQRETEEKELADWAAMQRRLAIRFAGGMECGQMSRERVQLLLQLPGWVDALG